MDCCVQKVERHRGAAELSDSELNSQSSSTLVIRSWHLHVLRTDFRFTSSLRNPQLLQDGSNDPPKIAAQRVPQES